MSRDLTKDKERINQNWSVENLSSEESEFMFLLADYYVKRCEAAETRISELEERPHPNNRPDVVSRQDHDRALELFAEVIETQLRNNEERLRKIREGEGA